MSAQVLTRSGERTSLSDETIDELRTTFHGVVLTDGDAGYDEATVVHNGMIRKHPGIIVRCSGTADVVDAVNLARERDLVVAVRGGGHGIAGHAIADDCVLIDLSAMRGVLVDPEHCRVRVQGGATWGDVDRESQLHALAVPGGIVSTTGVAGLTLGGGIGWLHRKWGLACDNLVSADVVLADGTVVRASESEHEDLLWALRGGGGNFGVVTAFEFEAHPLGPIVFNAGVMYAADDADEVLTRWFDWASGVDDEVTTRAVFWSMPAAPALPPEVHDRDVLITGALYAGSPEDGERATQAIRELATPLADLSGPMPYRMAQSLFDPFFPKGELRSYWKSVYLDDVDDDAAALVTRLGTSRPHPLTMVHVPLLGGAMSRVVPDATAFGDRSADYMLSVDGNWTDPADDEADIAWVRGAIDRAGELSVAEGTYLNFGGEAKLDEADRNAAFGQNLERLRDVKGRYDPENRFRLNANIPPAP